MTLPPSAPSALQQLRESLPELNPTMRAVAEALLEDPLRAGSISITQIARIAGASPATVSRLAARLGHDGFPALRSAIALDNGRTRQSGWERDIGGAVSPEDPPRRVLDTLAGTAARSLRDAVDLLDVELFEQAAARIAAADRVHLYGDWGDSIALRELQMRLMRIGVAAWFHEAGHTTLRLVAHTLTAQDAVVVLGRSGRDQEAVSFLRDAAAAGAATIALHGDADSPIAAEAELALYTGVRNGTVWTQYYAGRVSDVLATSFLWLLVAQKRSADPTTRYVDDGTFGTGPGQAPCPADSHRPTTSKG